MAWAELRRFSPNSLRAQLSEVEALHQFMLPLGDPPPDLLKMLRLLLSRTERNDVPNLASTLTKRELTALADLLTTRPEKDIETKAIALGMAVNYRGLVSRSWHLLVAGGPLASLEQLVRGGLQSAQWRGVTGDQSSVERVATWLVDAGLIRGLMADLDSSGRQFSEWLDGLPPLTTKISPSSLLASQIRTAILVEGSQALLTRHKSNLLDWLAEAATEAKSVLPEHFAANYLHRYREGRAWEPRIVDWITRHLALPRPGNLVDAWRRIDTRSPGVVRELASWLALKELERFFREVRDPHGRFRFWRDNFGDEFAFVEPLAHRTAMLLHIPPLAVVEFADIGNAAYVYHEKQLPWISVSGERNVEYYKRRNLLMPKPSDGTEFRIHHHKGWQRRYLNDLKTLIARARR